jgi:hypothetical protein
LEKIPFQPCGPIGSKTPDSGKAIDEFVEAEAILNDPLGGLMQEQLGPVQWKIRDILDFQRRS